MAVITKIEEQKNKKRVNIFVDDAFFCGLTKETAVVFKLKVGKEVNESQLQDAIFDSEVKMAFDKASDYLGSRMHSKKELFDKLLKKGYPKEVISKAIEKLEEYHYVDDGLYSKQFTTENKRYSKRMIENKLKAKGVSTDLIEQSIEEYISDEDEFELCLKFAEKYVKSKDMSKEGSVQKLISSLARRGFAFDDIKRACKKVLDAEKSEIIENFDEK